MRHQYTVVIEPKDPSKVVDLCEPPETNSGCYFICRDVYLSQSELELLKHHLRYNAGIKDCRIKKYDRPGDTSFLHGLGDLPRIFARLDPSAVLRAPTVKNMVEALFVPQRSPRREIHVQPSPAVKPAIKQRNKRSR